MKKILLTLVAAGTLSGCGLISTPVGITSAILF